MMTNMFSSFNPITSQSLSSMWMSIILIFYLFPMILWFSKSLYFQALMNLTTIIMKQFMSSINKTMNSSMIMFISVMITILSINTIGLFPYSFPISSHPQITMSVSLSMWTAIMAKKIKMPFNLLSHMVPPSTPKILIPFMILVESISLLIQPLTLAIRLMANITAGHILLYLISTAYNSMSFIPLILSQSLLMMMELCVALIQAYVMAMLLTMYTK